LRLKTLGLRPSPPPGTRSLDPLLMEGQKNEEI
jgi:hypothetical protein